MHQRRENVPFFQGLIEGTVTAKFLLSQKQREGRQDRRKPAVPRLNLIYLG
jgi:hypothetical protein